MVSLPDPVEPLNIPISVTADPPDPAEKVLTHEIIRSYVPSEDWEVLILPDIVLRL